LDLGNVGTSMVHKNQIDTIKRQLRWFLQNKIEANFKKVKEMGNYFLFLFP
jgi:hypothetical protein